MKLRRRLCLLWTDSPWIIRMGVSLVTVILTLILFGCATVPDGVQITVSHSRADECRAAGGCGLVSEAEIASMKMRAYRQGMEAAAREFSASLDSHGCRRDQT